MRTQHVRQAQSLSERGAATRAGRVFAARRSAAQRGAARLGGAEGGSPAHRQALHGPSWWFSRLRRACTTCAASESSGPHSALRKVSGAPAHVRAHTVRAGQPQAGMRRRRSSTHPLVPQRRQRAAPACATGQGQARRRGALFSFFCRASWRNGHATPTCTPGLRLSCVPVSVVVLRLLIRPHRRQRERRAARSPPATTSAPLPAAELFGYEQRLLQQTAALGARQRHRAVPRSVNGQRQRGSFGGVRRAVRGPAAAHTYPCAGRHAAAASGQDGCPCRCSMQRPTRAGAARRAQAATPSSAGARHHACQRPAELRASVAPRSRASVCCALAVRLLCKTQRAVSTRGGGGAARC
jgi:hypothetical protein